MGWWPTCAGRAWPQAAISAARLQRKVGRTLDVLVDAVEDGVAIARTTGDAPEIDGVVRIRDGHTLNVGEFARTEITAADAHDLTGRLVEASGKQQRA